MCQVLPSPSGAHRGGLVTLSYQLRSRVLMFSVGEAPVTKHGMDGTSRLEL